MTMILECDAKEKRKMKNHEQYLKNKEWFKEWNKNYYKAHKEYYKESNKRYYEENKEYHKQYMKDYYQKNKPLYRLRGQLMYAKKHGQEDRVKELEIKINELKQNKQ